MSSSFSLTLDTTPPQIDVLPASRFGTQLVIPYTQNEPGIISASFVPETGAPVELIIGTTTLSAPNVPEVPGSIVLTVRDAVFNFTTRVITLSGRTLDGIVTTGRIARGRPGKAPS